MDTDHTSQNHDPASESSTTTDWDSLRKLSLQPGGFRDERVAIWPKLLHVTLPLAPDTASTEHDQTSVSQQSEPELTDECPTYEENMESSAHRDERQIGLDTDRSFVLYPVDPSHLQSRERLQAELHELIVTVFRKRQRLNYFQGYHDIVSVLFLTLPKELQVACVEKLSLHRVRDSMGASLEPVVGLLRILKRLIQVTDPKFSELLDRNAPLPYFALSNLLTLLSHDVPTLPLIQHVFDYLLCRHPIAIVYLAAAVVLSRREEVYELEKEGEEGMTHSMLSSLPELYEDAVNGEALSMDADDTEDVVEETQGPTAVEDNKPETSLETALAEESKGGDVDVSVDKETTTRADALLPSYPSNDSNVDDAAQSEDAPSVYAEFADPILRSPSSSDIETLEVVLAAKSEDQELPEKNPLSASFTSSEDSLPRSRVSLTSLFTRADELYSQYPPSHPSIAVSSIMGPQSIMLTWSENPAELPDDDDAELMVTKPELIVLPYIEPEDEVASDDDSAAAWGKRRRREYEAERRRRRKLRKPRRLGDMVIQRKTMVVGAVLVLGVAMAVYGIQAGGPSGPFRSAGDAHHHRHDIGKEWKRVSQFVGGALSGMGERVFDGLWH